MKKNEHTDLEHAWSVISHDLASPLWVMSNHLNHIDKTLLPKLLDSYKTAKAAGLNVPVITSSQLETYQNILKSVESTVEQVRQQISRLNHKLLPKHFRAENKPTEIIKSVKEAIEHYQTSYSLEDKSLIHVNIQDAKISGDAELIQYIIFELLANAEYAMEANSSKNPGVFISSTTDDKHYYLKIKNESGPIAASDLPQLFDSYFSTKTSHIGLGLTFCKQAMQQMQGDITCHIEDEGKMIEFILTFSLAS